MTQARDGSLALSRTALSSRYFLPALTGDFTDPSVEVNILRTDGG